MSTRAAIARPTNDGEGEITFAGRYHHFDGYPTGLGAALFELYHTQFDRDLDKMLKVLIDDHPGGWSSVYGDFSMEPGYRDDLNAGTCTCGKRRNDHYCQYDRDAERHRKAYPCDPAGGYTRHLGHEFDESEESKRLAAIEARRPNCYCHGERSEGEHLITEENASGSGCEYVYVLKQTPDGAVMLILSSYTSIGSPTGAKDQKMIGFFGVGDEDAEWRPIGVVGLDREEAPDFSKIEEAA